jgi:thioester reductase-like protein
MSKMKTALYNWDRFYANKSAMVTGGTGFLGQELLSRLLSLNALKRIYVLVRGQSDDAAQQRLDKLRSDSQVLSMAHVDDDTWRRVVAVRGDITQRDLGINVEQRQRIASECLVFFHVAATTNFQAPLGEALSTNVGGATAMLELAHEAQLYRRRCRRQNGQQNEQENDDEVSLVHVSTAYVNAPRCWPADDRPRVVFERSYDVAVDAGRRRRLAFDADALRVARRLVDEPESALNMLKESDPDCNFMFGGRRLRGAPRTPHAVVAAGSASGMHGAREFDERVCEAAGYPNTYTLTKAIAERTVSVRAKKLGVPVAVVRPSVVIGIGDPAHQHCGWYPSFGGPGLFLLHTVLGLRRVLHARRGNVLDLVPVDQVNNVVVAAPVALAVDASGQAKTSPPPHRVFHATQTCSGGTPSSPSPSPSSPLYVPIDKVFDHAVDLWNELPKEKREHVAPFHMVAPLWLFRLLAFLFHIVPALLLDLSKLPSNVAAGRQYFFTVRRARHIDRAMEASGWFSTRRWSFDNAQARHLLDNSTSESPLFNRAALFVEQLDWRHYIRRCIVSLDQYAAELRRIKEAKKKRT